MEIKIFGARGSYPSCRPQNQKYGINTACVEIITENESVIFDAGTGIMKLSESRTKDSNYPKHIILSHYHSDHISGLAYFKPLMSKDYTAKIYGPVFNEKKVKEVLNTFIGPPFFPIHIDDFPSDLTFIDLDAGNEYDISPYCTIKTFACNHSDLTLGYRLQSEEKSICYITDTELGTDTNTELAEFIDSADILILDSAYTDDEYTEAKTGWGHSTWQQAVKLSVAAKIKKLVLFHHSPDRTDLELDIIEKKAQEILPGTIVAQEGMVITL